MLGFLVFRYIAFILVVQLIILVVFKMVNIEAHTLVRTGQLGCRLVSEPFYKITCIYFQT